MVLDGAWIRCVFAFSPGWMDRYPDTFVVFNLHIERNIRLANRPPLTRLSSVYCGRGTYQMTELLISQSIRRLITASEGGLRHTLLPFFFKAGIYSSRRCPKLVVLRSRLVTFHVLFWLGRLVTWLILKDGLSLTEDNESRHTHLASPFIRDGHVITVCLAPSLSCISWKEGVGNQASSILAFAAIVCRDKVGV